jgi:multidrug resistance efflux pump
VLAGLLDSGIPVAELDGYLVVIDEADVRRRAAAPRKARMAADGRMRSFHSTDRHAAAALASIRGQGGAGVDANRCWRAEQKGRLVERLPALQAENARLKRELEQAQTVIEVHKLCMLLGLLLQVTKAS